MKIEQPSKITELVSYKIRHNDASKKPSVSPVTQKTPDYTIEISAEAIEKSIASKQKNIDELKKKVDIGDYQITDTIADKIAEDITSMFIRGN